MFLLLEVISGVDGGMRDLLLNSRKEIDHRLYDSILLFLLS